MTSDEELLNELQEKAMTVGMDLRWLINKLIKRYKIRCFELNVLSGKSVYGPRRGDLAGYDMEELVCVAELLCRSLIQKEELGTMKQEIRRLENGVEVTIRFPGAGEAVQAFLDEKDNK